MNNEMKSIHEYEEDGYVGQDANLETSLFEYGSIWKRVSPTETHFIYGIWYEDGEFTSFDSSVMTLDDYLTGFWFERDRQEGLFEYLGTTREEMMATDDFSAYIPDLVAFYGYENVFGTSYYRGFSVWKMHR